MQSFTPADSVHRLVKQAMDSGAAESLEAAERLFLRYRVVLVIDDDDATDPAHQAALLTAIALARRVFLGGVDVAGSLNVRLLVPIVVGDTLAAAAQALGAGVVASAATDRPRIDIGGKARTRTNAFHVRTTFSGWRGGIVPCEMPVAVEHDATPLAAMLAASFAVSEAFSFVRGEGTAPGRRDVGLSLWRPADDWLDEATIHDEPPLRFLPSRLWLLGLGHLGQAFLWALGLHPFGDASQVHLLLQDIDLITPSTESTSILTERSALGEKKTRAMARWAERRGFRTTVCERRFDQSTSRREEEPSLALCGVDNALARRALDTTGFDLVVEAGLGRGFDDFRALRLHVLPGPRPAADLWRVDASPVAPIDRAAYRKLQADGLDQCGVTLLAGKAVGAPFVGAVAACLGVAEVLRLLHGGIVHHVIDLDVSAVEHRSLVGHPRDFRAVNPGFITVPSAAQQ